jgi:hypothetical protein
MKRTATARPSVLPWLVGAMLWGAVSPAAAQERQHACLAPSGGDDTAMLQEALDRCSGAKHSCSVRLCAGVFDTGILRVRDFRGTLRGAGRERTVLRALPDLHVSEDEDDFFRDDPFGPDPWPYLVQFIEARGRVENLGILVPAPPAGTFPTTGWHLIGGGPIFELRGGLLVTGREAVDFEVRHVRVDAEEDPGSALGTTVFNGVEFGGLLFNPGDQGEFPVFPARGRFHVTDSRFEGVLTGTPIGELAEASVLVARNRYRSTIAVEVIDADRSRIGVYSNRWVVSYRGVQVRQNLDGTPSRESRLAVNANRGRVEPFLGDLGDGLSFVDTADPSPEPATTALRVVGNSWTLGNGKGAAASGITASGAVRLSLALNRLAGRAGTGLEVDETSGCRVWGNSLRGLDTGDGPDLHLGPATSDCVAIVGHHDVVVDDGSANRVLRW